MFNPQFAEMVREGKKRQTIRQFPARMPVVGDLESWRTWSGKPYRSKQTELAQVMIIEVQQVKISSLEIQIEGQWLSSLAQAKLAKSDGFPGLIEMLEWFEREHGLPFAGILIRAEDFRPVRQLG